MRWLLLLLLTGFAATCGQKGPLDPPPRFAQGATVMTIGHSE
ncbi:MAG: lipoprotein [Pseudomonadales bacterium]